MRRESYITQSIIGPVCVKRGRYSFVRHFQHSRHAMLLSTIAAENRGLKLFTDMGFLNRKRFPGQRLRGNVSVIKEYEFRNSIGTTLREGEKENMADEFQQLY